MLDTLDIEGSFLAGDSEGSFQSSPERKLIAAIIRRAIFDASWQQKELRDRKHHNWCKAGKREARVWLRSDCKEEGSFLWYLDLAGMELGIQEHILKLCDTIEQRIEDEKMLLEEEENENTAVDIERRNFRGC